MVCGGSGEREWGQVTSAEDFSCLGSLGLVGGVLISDYYAAVSSTKYLFGNTSSAYKDFLTPDQARQDE